MFHRRMFQWWELLLWLHVRVQRGTTNSSRISAYVELTIILIFQSLWIFHSVYDYHWNNGRRILDLNHIYICCWLWDSTKGVSLNSWMYSSVIDTSNIFLYRKLHIGGVNWGVDVLLTTVITPLKIYWLLMVLKIWKWYGKFVKKGES